ncbi:MAG TPA: hypothetical protein DCY07_09010 [Rhodospirillaceae bacterium]|nr:hypothetical protein [Rhodospirillaceae bacterium]
MAWSVAKERPTEFFVTGVSFALATVQTGLAVFFAKTGGAVGMVSSVEAVLGATFFLALATGGVSSIRDALKRRSVRKLYEHQV